MLSISLRSKHSSVYYTLPTPQSSTRPCATRLLQLKRMITCQLLLTQQLAKVDHGWAWQGPLIFAIVPPSSALYIELIQGVFTSSSPLVLPETKIDIELTKIEVFGRALLLSVTVLASGGIFSNF